MPRERFIISTSLLSRYTLHLAVRFYTDIRHQLGGNLGGQSNVGVSTTTYNVQGGHYYSGATFRSGYTHYNFEKTGPNTHTIARLGFVAASKAFSLQGSVSHGEFVHQDVVEAQPPPR